MKIGNFIILSVISLIGFFYWIDYRKEQLWLNAYNSIVNEKEFDDPIFIKPKVIYLEDSAHLFQLFELNCGEIKINKDLIDLVKVDCWEDFIRISYNSIEIRIRPHAMNLSNAEALEFFETIKRYAFFVPDLSIIKNSSDSKISDYLNGLASKSLFFSNSKEIFLIKGDNTSSILGVSYEGRFLYGILNKNDLLFDIYFSDRSDKIPLDVILLFIDSLIVKV